MHRKISKIYRKDSHIDVCFLCRGKLLKSKNDKDQKLYNTKEHIFSDQILKKFKWNQTLRHKPFSSHVNQGIYNQESYPELKIPCCKNCNNNILNNTYEEITKTFLNIKYKDIHEDNTKLINDAFDWAAFTFYKIFYNVHLKESIKRKHKRVKISQLWDIYILILYKVRFLNVSFNISSPGSIFIFKCKETTKDISLNFDFVDQLHGGLICARIGKIGFIVSLYDHGFLDYIFSSSELIQKIKNKKFNPLQFRCLVAFADYSLRRLLKMPGYYLKEHKQFIEIGYFPFTTRRSISYSKEDRLKVCSEYIFDKMETYEFLVDEENNFRNLRFDEGYANIKSTVIIKN